MFDIEFETEENKIKTKDKIEPQHFYSLSLLPGTPVCHRLPATFRISQQFVNVLSASQSAGEKLRGGRGKIESYKEEMGILLRVLRKELPLCSHNIVLAV